MKKEEYTVTEAAKILNITRQSIYNKLNSLNDVLQPHISKKNNVKYLSNEAVEIIQKNINGEDVKSNLYNIDKELIDLYKNQINDLQNHVATIKSTYEEQIKNLTNTYRTQIEYIKEESNKKTNQLENKDKLLENMQVLLKDTKEQVHLLENTKNKKSIWHFWKKN